MCSASAVGGLPGIGAFAYAACADVDFNAEAVRLLFEIFQITLLEALEHPEFGEEDGVEFQRCSIVNILRGLPACGANGEVIEADGEFPPFDGGMGERRCGSGERACEEGTAIHAAQASGDVSAVDDESSAAQISG